MISLRAVRTVRAAGALAAVALLAGCTGGGDGASSESVFSVRPGQCFEAPTEVKAQLSSLKHIPCSTGHTREAYAVVTYAATGGGPSPVSSYPGPDALSNFAKGVCAQRFKRYVGVDYLDSALFFTYLFPSARSWEQDDDRKIVCFVTTTGQKLSSSVKDTRK